MAKVQYSIDLCRELINRVQELKLIIPYRHKRYEAGDVLDLAFTSVWPENKGSGRFRIEKFVGGGFAGQVYRCVLEDLKLSNGGSCRDFKEGNIYAVKIMIPPSRFARFFRNVLYWIAFQAPFSAQVNKGACKAGLIWQKLARIAGKVEFGYDDAVADVYGSFYDEELESYGEIREWVEGRTWRLEADVTPQKRRKWKKIDPRDTGSPEYVAKHQFMYRFVKMLHAMGAPELARQYEWWTMKSQPNALKREGSDDNPLSGLCAVDFRAGLALLPFLPMSIGDFGLIFSGLRRGSLAQFDRCDYKKLREYAAQHEEIFAEYTGMIEALESYDRKYRRSMPDITHHGHRLLVDRSLRADVRKGLVEGYQAADIIDADFGHKLASGGCRFTLFYLLGAIPIVGRLVRKLWGNRLYRQHFTKRIASMQYLSKAIRGAAISRVIEWHRAGRTSERRTNFLSRHPGVFWIQRFMLGFLPIIVHRALAEPSFIVGKIRDSWNFITSFYRDADFREQWLTDLVQEGYEDGMLNMSERDAILAHVKDPFIVKYLKCVAVHFATLPVTQIVSISVGMIAAVWMLMSGDPEKATWTNAVAVFGSIVIIFQIIPISPGSICRGLYVLYLMIRERNFRDYMIAAPLSFVKYIGYLSFPLQMATSYPALARFMAGRWATSAVHIVPVFGEKGALLEHFIFDMFFNFPRIIGRWLKAHIRGFLTLWLLLGVGLLTAAFSWWGVDWKSSMGINLIIGVVGIFILPRVLFYPVLKRKKR